MSIQQTIIKGIKEQLYFNDYLVLPQFGGFVLKSNNAHFSGAGGSLMPPSKTVSFNAQLKQNDGILATWLQKQLNCSASEAITQLTDFASYCSSILNTKRRLNIEGIGFFFLDFENNICFEPQADSNFLSDSFGLAPVSLQEIIPATKTPEKESVFVDRRPVRNEEYKPAAKRFPVNIAAVANYVFAAFVVFSLLILLVANSKINGELKSSLIGSESRGIYSVQAYTPLDIEPVINKKRALVADANGIAMFEISSNKAVAVKAIETLNETSSSSIAIAHSFDVVLGCFTVLDNADRMVKKLKGQKFKAHISGKNSKGMFVVSSGSYGSKEEATKRLLDIKGKFPKAWIKQPE